MKTNYLTNEALAAFIESAIQEDIGPGDHSSLASIPETAERSARLLVKADGILAGVSLAEMIFNSVDSRLSLEVYKKDGDQVKNGDIAFLVKGPARSILSAERLVLNCMQRMSGIASYTHQLSQMIGHTKAKVLDTRKTTPNFRIAEKWAVKIGGGENHRFALYDMIMLKDNHIDFAGGIPQAIEATRKYLKEKQLDLRIEIETRNLEEVQEVLDNGGVDVIMLDNMAPPQMKEAVRLIDGRFEVEASGGITEETIVAVAETGVDFISVGALTHSYTSLDMSLKAL